MTIPENVEYIINKLAQERFEAYAVGGCVRDTLMGITPKDWDIATAAKPEVVKQLFKKTYDTGLQHGTVTLIVGDETYEVTTFRIDGAYLDSRHPSDVTFSTDITKDLERRDFTINAMAFNKTNGLIDPFGGQKDIQRRRIKAVGSPEARIHEDALRMLRAVRFSARLSFDIEQHTAEAIIKNAALITKISNERVRDELILLIMSVGATKIFSPEAMALLRHIDARLAQSLAENETLLRRELEACKRVLPLRLAVLIHYLNDNDAAVFLKKLKLSNVMYHRTLKAHQTRRTKLDNNYYAVVKAVNQWGIESFEDYLYLSMLDFYILQSDCAPVVSVERHYRNAIDNEYPIFIKDLNVNGHDLHNEFKIAGTTIGATLTELLDYVHRHPRKNDYASLLKHAYNFITKG